MLAVAMTAASSQAQQNEPALDPAVFPVPAVLQPNVRFWRAIFSKYDSTQTVIHDDTNLDVIYDVVDVGDLVEQGASDVAVERARRDRVQRAIEKYQGILRALAGQRGAQADPADEARVRALFADAQRPSTDFRAAIDRVRAQGGLRDTFRDALRTSGMFIPGIERILAKYGVPTEIARLPFVESMFNYEARSKAGASGVWQFTRSTGRLYLQIGPAVDERSDVWLAAEGAARLLAEHYGRVHSWPVALTAYNHGIAGMVRAVSQVGSNDIGVIVERYHSPSFGFASRNFYAEFVAVATLYAERDEVFPEVDPLPALAFDEFIPGKYVSLLDLAHLTGTPAARLADLNPALDAEVVQGHLLVPASYPLRVPEGHLADFRDAFDELPAARKRDRQLAVTYRIDHGDTLGSIARRFGTSVSALQNANHLGRSTRIYIGQSLDIPNGGATGWSPLVWTGGDRVASRARSAAVHVVRAGETLGRIAGRYGTTVRQLVEANGLVSTVIQVGQRLEIPK